MKNMKLSMVPSYESMFSGRNFRRFHKSSHTLFRGGPIFEEESRFLEGEWVKFEGKVAVISSVELETLSSSRYTMTLHMSNFVIFGSIAIFKSLTALLVIVHISKFVLQVHDLF